MASEELFGSAPLGWEYKTLAAACAEGGGNIQTGPFGSQLHAADYVPIGIPSIMPQNIGDNRLHEEGIARITPEDARRLSRYLVRAGDIVYSRRGDVERRALVRTHEDGWLCGTGCLRVRLGEKGADPQFVSHYLGHPSVREWIVRHAHGATMPNLNTSILGACPFLEPPIDEQRAIAHILGTLDDKIELNRKQNETLEAMARALFKAWFVDFEPVRAKMEGRWQRGQSRPGLPAHLYDIFPDRIVESESGDIPAGWRVFAFGDVAQQGKGAVNPGNSPQDTFTHYSLPAFDSAQSPYIELGSAIKSNKTPVPDGAVLVSKLNPHIPRVWQVGKAGVNAVCSTEFIVWTPRPPANNAFLYCLASSSEFNSAMRQLVTGTSNSHQRVKPDQLREIRVFTAADSVIEAFSEAVRLPMEQVIQNRQQSHALAQLRDTLLPKLISGELRVPDAERIVGAAV